MVDGLDSKVRERNLLQKFRKFIARTILFGVPIITVGALDAAEPPALPGGFQKATTRVVAPAIPMQDVAGDLTNLAEWRGKIIVLNIWATWCGPCVKELPALDRLAARMPSDRLVVLAVSEDKGGAATVKQFLAKLGVTKLKAFVDPNRRFSRTLGTRGLPTTFILDKDGTMLGHLEGPAEWDSDAFVSPLRALTR